MYSFRLSAFLGFSGLSLVQAVAVSLEAKHFIGRAGGAVYDSCTVVRYS